MSLLNYEREVMDNFTPSLRDKLNNTGYQQLEQTQGLGFTLFKECSAPSLLIPKEYDGLGSTAKEAVSFQLALGSLAPSLAIATTMHQYKVVTLAEMNKNGNLTDILKKITANNWLVASGGSEGIPGQSLFNPQTKAVDTEFGIEVTGSKKPCSMTWSMDLLSIMIKSDDNSRYSGELLNVLVEPTHPSVKREKYFNNSVLYATESDIVIFEKTPIPEKYIFPLGSLEEVKPFTNVAFLWFEILATSSYLGMAGRLLQKTVELRDRAIVQLADLIVSFDTHRLALEQLASKMDEGDRSEEILNKALNVRYSTQKAIAEITSVCFELLGGLHFSQSTEAQSLMTSARALCFHPPNKSEMNKNITQQCCPMYN